MGYIRKSVQDKPAVLDVGQYTGRGKGYNVMCEDGVRRTVTIIGPPDTAFSIPANCHVRGLFVSGFVAHYDGSPFEDSHDMCFIAVNKVSNGRRLVQAGLAEEITEEDTKVYYWAERDRGVCSLETNVRAMKSETLIEFRDEDLAQAIEDGFLIPPLGEDEHTRRQLWLLAQERGVKLPLKPKFNLYERAEVNV